MQVAADLVRAELHRQRMQQRPAATAGFATWTRRVDEQDLLATDQDLLCLEGTGVPEPLDHDVHELDLVVLVEQVGHAIGGQPDPARQHAVLGVRDEVDHAGAAHEPSPGRAMGSAGSDPGRWNAKSRRRPASWIMLRIVGPPGCRATHPEVPLRT